MITVLYVDKDPTMFPILSHIFAEYASVSVFPAASGEEAIEWLSRNDADVIVSEYDLPVMNGIALLHALFSRGISLPFIFFSERDSVQVKNEAYPCDVFGFIARKGSERKPIINLLRQVMWVAGNQVLPMEPDFGSGGEDV
jgi:DNA-binding NtrC family response regulator